MTVCEVREHPAASLAAVYHTSFTLYHEEAGLGLRKDPKQNQNTPLLYNVGVRFIPTTMCTLLYMWLFFSPKKRNMNKLTINMSHSKNLTRVFPNYGQLADGLGIVMGRCCKRSDSSYYDFTLASPPSLAANLDPICAHNKGGGITNGAKSVT